MKKIKPILLLMIGLCIISCSCSNDDPIPTDPSKELPPITTSGAGTFGCLINGEVWLPEGPGSPFSPNPHAKYDENNDQLILIAEHNDTDIPYESFFFGKVIEDVGNYNLNDYPNSIFSIVIENTLYDYYLDTVQINALEIIKLDRQSDIISGKFEFSLINVELTDTLHITNGRFDLTYFL